MSLKMSASEETLLVELLRKYCWYSWASGKRKSDVASILATAKMWKAVETDFNRRGLVIKRTAKQLKKAWGNMMKAKRQLSQRMSNADGSNEPSIDSKPELEVAALVTNHRYTGSSQLVPEEFEIDETEDVVEPTVEEVWGVVAPATRSASATASATQESTPRSILRRAMEEWLCLSRHATEDEIFICQIRREMAMMDMQIRESEIATSAARLAAAEAEAKRAEVRLALFKEELAASKAAAKVRLAASQVDLARMEESLKRAGAVSDSKTSGGI